MALNLPFLLPLPSHRAHVQPSLSGALVTLHALYPIILVAITFLSTPKQPPRSLSPALAVTFHLFIPFLVTIHPCIHYFSVSPFHTHTHTCPRNTSPFQCSSPEPCFRHSPSPLRHNRSPLLSFSVPRRGADPCHALSIFNLVLPSTRARSNPFSLRPSH